MKWLHDIEKMKHTPGPWYQLDGVVYADDENRSYIVAECRDSIIHSEDYEGNARLIAVAPDLLEALEKAQRLLTWAATEVQRTEILRYLSGGFKESVEDAVFKDSLKIEEAIKKARGL